MSKHVCEIFCPVSCRQFWGAGELKHVKDMSFSCNTLEYCMFKAELKELLAVHICIGSVQHNISMHSSYLSWKSWKAGNDYSSQLYYSDSCDLPTQILCVQLTFCTLCSAKVKKSLYNYRMIRYVLQQKSVYHER